MTPETAYRILGLPDTADRAQIKKTYHQLLHRIHPDTDAFETAAYPYTIQELNEAYALLYKNTKNNADRRSAARNASHTAAGSARTKKRHTSTSGNSTHTAWSAPENPTAYADRDIYHYVEDSDGVKLGTFVIASGKYLWTPEEDFPLFLKSMFGCSDRILSHLDQQLQRDFIPQNRLAVQAELSYLLAQQFIDLSGTLARLLASSSSETDNGTVYTVPAMLETTDATAALRSGTLLYPSGIKKHRLFLQTGRQQAAGYVSFKDDRLYYVLIPLLEQKRAQVKISVAPLTRSCTRHNHTHRGTYRDLDFQIRLPKDSAVTFPESIQLQIDALLQQYSKM